jgi:hypothetical protein
VDRFKIMFGSGRIRKDVYDHHTGSAGNTRPHREAFERAEATVIDATEHRQSTMEIIDL